jgi:hypothetical protein
MVLFVVYGKSVGYFFHYFVQLVFIAGHVSRVLPNNLPIGIEHKRVRGIAHIHGAFKIAVGIEKNLVFPRPSVHKRLNP